ncbi:hypothetical protein XPA_008439 [Xanthoria parietina]
MSTFSVFKRACSLGQSKLVGLSPGSSRKLHLLSSIPRLAASSLEDSSHQAHTDAIATALRGPGVAIVDLKFPDASSEYLRRLVLNLGNYHNHGPPITHSATRGWFWDVRPKKTAGPQARSESSLNFPWHTDCSYESDPPQFFALHVLHADRRGGGTLSALNVSRALKKLKPATFETLSRPEFRIKVPPEFAKGVDNITGCLVGKGEEGSGVRIRYRADIIEPLSSGASDALAEVHELLASSRDTDARDVQVDLSPQVLPDNAIVLMDNGRWLHARNEVRDPERHLRRVRWGRRKFEAGD